MKLDIKQLRRLISEAISEATGNSPDVVIGGVYYDPKGREVSVEFLEGEQVGYNLLSGGKVKSFDDSTVTDLKAFLVSGGFELDHVEQW